MITVSLKEPVKVALASIHVQTKLPALTAPEE